MTFKKKNFNISFQYDFLYTQVKKDQTKTYFIRQTKFTKTAHYRS